MSWIVALYLVWEMVSKDILYKRYQVSVPHSPCTEIQRWLPTLLPVKILREFGRLGGCWVMRKHTWWWQKSTGPAFCLHSSSQCRSAPFPWLPLAPPLQEAGHWGLQSETIKSSAYTSVCSSGWFWPESLHGQPRSINIPSSPTKQHFYTHFE